MYRICVADWPIGTGYQGHMTRWVALDFYYPSISDVHKRQQPPRHERQTLLNTCTSPACTVGASPRLGL